MGLVQLFGSGPGKVLQVSCDSITNGDNAVVGQVGFNRQIGGLQLQILVIVPRELDINTKREQRWVLDINLGLEHRQRGEGILG